MNDSPGAELSHERRAVWRQPTGTMRFRTLVLRRAMNLCQSHNFFVTHMPCGINAFFLQWLGHECPIYRNRMRPAESG